MKEQLNLSLPNSVKHDSSLISFSASWPVNNFLISANYLLHAVTVFNFYFLNYLLMQLQFQNFPNYLVMQLHFYPELILHEYSVEGQCNLVINHQT